MISSTQELAAVMKLDFFEKVYPTPQRGEGDHVAEIFNTYTWEAVLQAAEALTDEELKAVIAFTKPISFHNNSNGGHSSVGATWTIKYFFEYNGGSELKERIKNLSKS